VLLRRHSGVLAVALLVASLALFWGGRRVEWPGRAEMRPTPPTVSPGPPGDFTWKGLNWRRRTEPGRPSRSGRWSPANVVGPDARGFITLRLTNPSGAAPVAAEFDSTGRGFGYGTYTVVVDAHLARLDPHLVFGGLFTYDSSMPSWSSHNEIDANETSAWGRGRVQLNNAYFKDNPPGASVGDSIVVRRDPVPAARVQTHQLVWAPGRITWRSWYGAGGRGRRPFREAVVTSDVPRPNREAICFNLWDRGKASAEAAPTEVTLRDFSFVPLGTPANG
jgi:hypothetical protein